MSTAVPHRPSPLVHVWLTNPEIGMALFAVPPRVLASVTMKILPELEILQWKRLFNCELLKPYVCLNCYVSSILSISRTMESIMSTSGALDEETKVGKVTLMLREEGIRPF